MHERSHKSIGGTRRAWVRVTTARESCARWVAGIKFTIGFMQGCCRCEAARVSVTRGAARGEVLARAVEIGKLAKHWPLGGCMWEARQ